MRKQFDFAGRPAGSSIHPSKQRHAWAADLGISETQEYQKPTLEQIAKYNVKIYQKNVTKTSVGREVKNDEQQR